LKLLISTVLSALFLLASAGSALADLTRVAQANFDNDTVGDAPDGSLPGGPDGDSFFYPTFGVGAFSVVDALAGLTNQPVRGVRTAGPGSFNFGLNLSPVAATAQELVFRFRYAPVSGTPYIFVILRGTNLAVHGSLTLSATTVLFSTASGAQNSINVGTMTFGQASYFEWTVDRLSGVQSLSIDGELVVDEIQTSYQASAININQLSFEGGLQDAMEVAVDDLEAFTGSGITPTSEYSWDQVKAVYR